MSWDDKHGCEGAGWNGSAEHLGDPLTVEQIKTLKPGTRIVVTWTGGNGPWEGTVALDPYYGVCHKTERGVLNALLSWPDTQTRPLNRVTLAVPRDKGEHR